MESALICVFLSTFFLINHLWALPINQTIGNQAENVNDTNETSHDLYVIRTVVYEIGILTDSDNDTDYSEETHEQVDLTFYSPDHNNTAIDLSNIPIPIQTNVSGQIITGIAPASFGVISLPFNLTRHNRSFLPLQKPIFPEIVVSQTKNASSTDIEEEKKLIENLPAELGI